MKTQTKISISVILILILSGCRGTWHQPFPDVDIVYQAGADSNGQGYKIGFVNPNGSGLAILDVGGSFRKPVWSADGSLIYGLALYISNNLMGYPSYWSMDGVLKVCKNWEHFVWITGTGNPNNLKEVIISSFNKILMINLENCSLIRSLLDFSKSTDDKSRTVVGFSLSPDRSELLYGLQISEMYESGGKTYNYSENHILKMDLITGKETDMVRGINPSWSPDGSHIAYILADGMYLMNSDGSQQRQLINCKLGDSRPGQPIGWDNIPMPRWSPDGQWIAYHRCDTGVCVVDKNTIYKVNVETGQEVKIVDGGGYPSWKP